MLTLKQLIINSEIMKLIRNTIYTEDVSKNQKNKYLKEKKKKKKKKEYKKRENDKFQNFLSYLENDISKKDHIINDIILCFCSLY